jgi:hypothetical protein
VGIKLTDRDIITLREYVDSRFSSLDKSIELARQQMEKRLDGMNEIREALRVQAGRFVTKDECLPIKAQLLDEVRALREFRVEMKSKADQQSVNIAIAVAVVSATLACFGLLLRAFGV